MWNSNTKYIAIAWNFGGKGVMNLLFLSGKELISQNAI